VVGSQNWPTPGSSTPGPSFDHNLCLKCPNEQYELILDIYASRAFHWHKERNQPLRFDPSNCSLKFRESIGTPSPNLGVALGVWRLPPSHSPTLPGVSDVTPGLPLGSHPYNPFALVASPKLGLRHNVFNTYVEWFCWVVSRSKIDRLGYGSSTTLTLCWSGRSNFARHHAVPRFALWQ
jgi:hypothetical protein